MQSLKSLKTGIPLVLDMSPEAMLRAVEMVLLKLIPDPTPPMTKCAPIRELIYRLSSNSKTTLFTLISTLQYVYRFAIRRRDARCPAKKYSGLRDPRRIFLAALLISHKFRYDHTYSNLAWSKLTHLSTREINALERAFLESIDYQLDISEPEEIAFMAWFHSFLHQSA